MLGSSQNIAMPNVVLNTTVAESFRQFADILEKAEDFDAAVGKLLKDTFAAHRRIIFDGNGYSAEWEEEAERRGLLNLRNSVEAYKHFNNEKNIKLFVDHGVMSRSEINSREEILFENYSKIINIEALTMIQMARRDIIPAVNAYLGQVAAAAAAKQSVIADINCDVEKDILVKLSTLNAEAYAYVETLKCADAEANAIPDVKLRAEACVKNVVPAMNDLREVVDAMEQLTSSEFWPMPTYSDLMFKI